MRSLAPPGNQLRFAQRKQKCGGIGTWTTPAAQIGASFFADVGVLVFDPFSSRVWISA